MRSSASRWAPSTAMRPPGCGRPGGGYGCPCPPRWPTPAAPARDAVDWPRLDVWWGDERFRPAGDPERNDTGARKVLLDHVALRQDRVHPMPGPDGPDGDDPEAAAGRYARWLRKAAEAQ